MKALNLYDGIKQNNRKILELILLFPAVLSCTVYVLLALYGRGFLGRDSPDLQASWGEINGWFLTTVPPLILVCLGITFLSLSCGKKMMLSFAKATPCPKTGNYIPLHHMVENLAIKAGLPKPELYLVQDQSLNAFATGYAPKSAAIALTTGIIQKLDPIELEAVISHEMGHILNRDIRLNMYIITGIGSLGFVAEMLLRSSGHNSSKRSYPVLKLTGIALLVFQYILAPFIHMAVSRSQEFRADATGAYLTRHPMALAKALQKISADPRVEVLDSSSEMACACICNPLGKITSLLDTHPPIKERIKRLTDMSGKM